MRISVDLKDSFDYCFENFVYSALDGADGDHSGIAAFENSVDKTQKAFGRLLEQLVGKGTLDGDALAVILDVEKEVVFVHDIFVISEHNIEGRGLIFAVERDPTIQVGHYVRVKRVVWKVCGIEYSGFSKAIGLLVREVRDE